MTATTSVTAVRTFPCLYCDHTSYSFGESKRHRNTLHPIATRVLHCPHCGREFINNGQAWVRHVASHDGMDERFFSKVYFTSGCWLWTAACDTNGYGAFTIHHRQHQAHRVAYEQMVGPIPEGMSLDHLCHNADTSCFLGNDCPHRRCVRPDHMEAIPLLENWKRGRGPLYAGARNKSAWIPAYPTNGAADET